MDNAKRMELIRIKSKPIIKNYEYRYIPLGEEMPKDDDDEMETLEVETSGNEVNADEAADAIPADVDMDEVNRIMAAFADKNQSSVDSLFESVNEPSMDDLISDLCAPKQNNVDDLVRSAKGE